MKLRVVILSVACFSCLIPPALSTNLLAVKEVASQAAENIASIGAETIAVQKAAVVKAAADIASIAASGVVLKGEALKTAAASIASAMFNGALSIGATIAKAGVNMVAAKFGAKRSFLLEPSIVIQPQVFEEVIQEDPTVVEYEPAIEVPVQIPPKGTVSLDVRSEFNPLKITSGRLYSIRGHDARRHLNDAGSDFEIVGPAHSPFVYEVVDTPQVFAGPLIETFQSGK